MNTAKKIKLENGEEVEVMEKKTWREKMAEELLIADASAKAAAKEKAEAKEAKAAEKKAKKEAKKKDKPEKLTLKQKMAIGGAVLGGAATIAVGILTHRSEEETDLELDSNVVEEEETEQETETTEE